MADLPFIKLNSTGPAVENWQAFLRGQHLYLGPIDGSFDGGTREATIAFQKLHGLDPDGKVGNNTYGAAMLLNFPGVTDTRTDTEGPNFPPKPTNLSPLVSNAAREAVFEKFAFKAAPQPDNPEHIIITDDWENRNIVTVEIPQLIHIKGSSHVRFHKFAARQLVKLWQDWEDAGLLHFVLEWDGSFEPRFVRGSTTVLSNHSFGSAFDINEPFNQFHTVPAMVGQKGCVRELVKIANDNGLYWGGHFSKPDGMHFEVAKIM